MYEREALVQRPRSLAHMRDLVLYRSVMHTVYHGLSVYILDMGGGTEF